MGDFNAKVCKEEEFCAVIGRNSLHSISIENGNRVLRFAASRNMVIGSTLLQHKDINKITWRSPDDSTYIQIEHILIDSRRISNLLNVRTFKGDTFFSHLTFRSINTGTQTPSQVITETPAEEYEEEDLIETPTIDELQDIINKLKNHKAAGPDGISPETYTVEKN
ncbi:uncharacterized protein CDAR_395361 [Caerostris darwini]|uniref:Endonuclease/exonuclease/phosphatase domain-containing protein n=1 Tax=Caerostris darwini TaxID=1538125 RepID=A0AAV4QA68_9ARAC|nr:uncharacterized protein CDAR_395361 [Caerostris darwini]